MITVYYSEKEFQYEVARAFKTGFNAESESKKNPDNKHLAEVSIVVGIMPNSKTVLERTLSRGGIGILIDKSYFRMYRDCVRLSVNDFHPFTYLLKAKCPSTRFQGYDIFIRKFQRLRGEHILIAGSSQKYCDWHGLGDVTEYVQNLVHEIKKHTSRPIIYRPKPSFKDAKPVDGAEFSHGEHKWFGDDLQRAWAVVGFGSNALLESMIYGVPVFNVGPKSVVWPICNHDLALLDDPPTYDRDTVAQYVSNITFCNWRLKDIARGKATEAVLEQMEMCNVPEYQISAVRRFVCSAPRNP